MRPIVACRTRSGVSGWLRSVHDHAGVLGVNAYDLALFTTDTTATGEQIVERYAVRWSIEPSNANSK